MKAIRYSPHPPEAYSRVDRDGRFGAGLEFVGSQYLPWWNLYWLSEPALDALMLPEDEWLAAPPMDPRLPQATAEALAQTLGGVPMQTLLTRPPSVFLQRLKGSPHTHLEPYKLLGAAWVARVGDRVLLAQAPEAAEQKLVVNGALPPRLFVADGNVLRVDFSTRRARAK